MRRLTANQDPSTMTMKMFIVDLGTAASVWGERLE